MSQDGIVGRKSGGECFSPRLIIQYNACMALVISNPLFTQSNIGFKGFEYMLALYHLLNLLHFIIYLKLLKTKHFLSFVQFGKVVEGNPLTHVKLHAHIFHEEK